MRPPQVKATAAKQSLGGRLEPLDLLRGLIIVLMALDHANHFIAHQHSSGEYWGGPLPIYPSTLAFLTRLVTHICAPGFFFLMGASMSLFAQSRRSKGWTEWQIIKHFLIRGLLLIVLQLTLINFIWGAGPTSFPSIYIGVLLALGGGMILTSPLLRLKPAFLLGLSLFFFIGTELLHPDPSLWNMLETDPYNLILLRSGGTGSFWSNYPILAWIELILFGMVFGRWLLADQRQAYRRAAIFGVLLLITFIGVRALDGFGNIRPRPGDGWMDFLSLVKYPPSMTFTLSTMGVNLVLMWAFSRIPPKTGRILQPLMLFGREPLFFYLLHLGGYAVLGIWLTPDGSSLGLMYAIWLVSLVGFYAITMAYTRFKQTRSAGSLWRFL